VTKDFYLALAMETGCVIKRLGEHPAMSNRKDGWNVYCVLEKLEDDFISRDVFEALNYRDV